ncbi:MOSC domain-containing protein [Plantactinospora sp. WMMB334]|uniref:MOSC domain-containing protein n=1 Tax=Plantactinospora sp. WMMB334 TaxID=3404119 RepID=UPI003B95233E
MSDPIPAHVGNGVVVELITYPIKGCAGVSLQRAVVTPAGLAHDRSFMVVDPAGVFRSQRRDPRLALIRPDISADGGHLTLSAPDCEPLRLTVDIDAARRDVLLFGAPLRGIDQGDVVAGWLSQALGVPSRLVRVPPEHDRRTDGETPGTSGYADSSAIHLLSRASVESLNERLRAGGAGALPTSRFRPNIVVDGWPGPHTEDHLRHVSVGSAELGFAKRAARCAVTAVDQKRGVRTGPEPLRTLAAYRRFPDGVVLGVKFAVTRPGEIGVGAGLVVGRWAPDADDRRVPARPASHDAPDSHRGTVAIAERGGGRDAASATR